MKILVPIALALAASLACLAPAAAQTADAAAARPPSVTVNASATATLPNDRMYAWLRAEKEDASAASAAADVNARMARVLAELKKQPAIDVTSTGYSTGPVVDKDKAKRWRVSQAIRLDSGDFAVLAEAVGRLQGEGLLLGGLGYGLSDAARKRAETSLSRDAIKAWQQRAEVAAEALGFGAWRVGSVHVQTNDGARPYMMAMRSEMKAMGVAAAPAPVAADAGTTDVTVSVSGDAVLSSPR
jgi:predicted secreted protein